MHRRLFANLSLVLLLSYGGLLFGQRAASEEVQLPPQPEHTPEVKRYLDAIYHPSFRRYECKATNPQELQRWQQRARPVLERMLRLDDMRNKLRGHKANVTLGSEQDMGRFTRTLGKIHTEPEMSIPFWLLQPKGAGPFPVGIFVHGHSRNVGMDEYVGIAQDEENNKHIQEYELDVGLRAVHKGFIALVPAVRGFKPVEVPDLIGMYNKKPCRAHSTHCLMAGRTAFGERIWDIQRLVDYALTLPRGDSNNILLMGHSGGGGLATFAAAVEPRITVTVSSGWYNTFVADNGRLNHCECNTVPGLLQFGEVWDVAGLIAPRPFLVVSGTNDLARRAYDPSVVRAVERLREIYSSAGAKNHFLQAVAVGGHKYFNNLQWPFITRHLN